MTHDDDRVLLGVDIGTSSAKAVLIDPAGRLLATAVRAHALDNPAAGRFEHDAETVWWQGFTILVAELLEQVDASRIAAVAVSGIGPCVLPVDAAGAPLRSAILYGIDTRASRIAEDLSAASSAGGRPLRLDAQAVVPKMLWLREHEPEVWGRTALLLGCGGFLSLKLTGRATLDIYESGSYAPLLDGTGTGWDQEQALLDPALLPELVWSTEVIGAVTAAAAAETGLIAGTPVIAGTVDAAAEATGAGVSVAGDLMLMYGSTGFFIQLDDAPAPSEAFWTARFLDESTFSTAGGTNTLGTLVNWFRTEFGMAETAAAEEGGMNAFTALMDLGRRSPPGANGLLALPYFAGERTPIGDQDARGAVIGLQLTSTRADVYRALLEAIAFAIRDNLDAMAHEGRRPRRIMAIGGGANNEVLLQIVSDVTGLPQLVPENTVGAALGDALRAGVGIGMWEDLPAAATTVRHRAVLTPDPGLRDLYETRFGLYRELYRATASVMHRLVPGAADEEGRAG